MTTETPPEESLVEYGAPVTLSFGGRPVPALSDPRSGYVRFAPPSGEELERYYVEEYGRDNPGYYSVESDYAPARQAAMADLFEDLAFRFRPAGPLRVHEIGCSFGGVVAALAARGHDATGSDINAAAVEEGLRREGGARIAAAANTDALRALAEPVDAVIASHVLEHDPDLWETLRLIRERLRLDGLLIAAVPNALYLRAVLDGFIANPWTAYPDHLHMLTPGHVPILCRRVGLAPLHVVTRTLENNQWMRRHFGESFDTPRVAATWEFLLGRLGLGWELQMVLGRDDGGIATRDPEHVARLTARLEATRETERSVRAFLAASRY